MAKATGAAREPVAKRGRPSSPGGVVSSFSLGVIVGLFVSLADRRDHAETPAEPRPSGQNVDAHPLQLSPTQWRDVIWRSFRDFGRDGIPQWAAGVTYFSLLSLFPAISAFVSLYGLFANVADARAQLMKLHGLLPDGAVSVLTDEIQRLTATDHGALGLAFVISLGVSIWSATSGVKALIAALNVAFDETETRGFIRLTLLSLALTLGGIIVAAAGLAATVAAPPLFAWLHMPEIEGLAFLRWPALAIGAAIAISALYWFGPARADSHWRWITPGGCVAAVAWVVMSALFSWYVANFGHYNRTYGSLGAIVGFMTWIWLSLMVVLYGAELNAEIEKEANAGRSGSGPRLSQTGEQRPAP